MKLRLYPEENVSFLDVYSRYYITELGEGRMALEDQDLDNQDDDVAVRCHSFCNPDMSWTFRNDLVII